MMRLFGLAGFPLSHSFSKKYFTDKFERCNIRDARYENFEVEHLLGFRDAMEKLPGLRGLNITIPHKEKIIGLLDEVTPVVADIKACNCINIVNGKWTGYNTDAQAFETSFIPGLLPVHTHALILGTGGASKAVARVLKKLGIQILFASNTITGEGYTKYEDLDESVIKYHKVIINASPVGTFPAVEQKPRIPYNGISSLHYLYDLVYNPDKTAFLTEGEMRGARIKNGGNMLELQAKASWAIWNG